MAASNNTFKCIKRILTDDGYQKTSEWQSADMVECSDGVDIETKVNLLDTSLSKEINDLKKSVADGKALLAGSISAVIPTAGSASWSVLNTNLQSAFVSQYNRGVTDADARPNPASVNYKNGYNAGVTAADNRANVNSVNYKTGYNNGFAAGKNEVSISTQSRTVNAYFPSGNGNAGTTTLGYATLTYSFPHRVLGMLNFSCAGNAPYAHIFTCLGCSVSGNSLTVTITCGTNNWDWHEDITVVAVGY